MAHPTHIASTSGTSGLEHPSVDVSITTCKEFDKYRNPDGTINYDFFYENPQESELKLECSIIRHMLGQIKVGMDLSKVTLPTFILERRSLLEMYADHFSHAQLFSAITDGETSRDRMISSLKWYLSSFHAGRDYNVAKKPYNPLLGETFMCYYDLDAKCKGQVDGGPVPWAKPSSVAFYAEQVSHHPPVSAFYAENVEKRVMCNAHIWTKSRLTGLSIGVINAGRAVISLLDHSEQYIFTFPAAYAKGILHRKPYVELSGTVNVVCPQTGYKAEVEFLMKNMFNSKPNRLYCQVFTPGKTSPTEIIEGDWTGTLKYKKRHNEHANEIFLDVTATPLCKKIVRSLHEQGEKESRYLWRRVTAALFIDNLDLATKYKNELENTQREEEKLRKQNNSLYEPARFKRVAKDDEESPWWYYPSLVDRLQTIQRK